ncbi:winged helix-turn-helix domain-containing protein [Candidatus Woesearchaeota archaeon]|nr:winged helix-turn-helix domain-containing protein [Candidatus Woesearchaeota archaeon]
MYHEPKRDGFYFAGRGRQFISIFKRKEVTPQVTPKVKLTELESKILDKIKKNSKISRSQLSKELNISAYTVKEYVNRLKKKNMSKARKHCQSQTGSMLALRARPPHS